MLVNLKNIGDALRIVYDVNTVARDIRPGQSVAIDLHPKAVRRYQRAQEKGDTMEVILEDEFPEEVAVEQVDPPERKSEFTLREGQGLAPEKNKDTPEGRVRIKRDRIKANARHANKPKVAPQEKPAEPKTAQELLAAAPDIASDDDFLRIANKVLPKGTLPQRPKPSQIMDALNKHAVKESARLRKNK